jgi:hypothetical protein
MLAYYLEWHMRQCLAPMLFDDTDKEEAEARPSITWGDLDRFMKWSPGPSLRGGMVLMEGSVHH